MSCSKFFSYSDESDEAKDGDFDQNYSYDEEYWDDEFNSTTTTTTTAAPSGRRRKRQTTAAAKKKTRFQGWNKKMDVSCITNPLFWASHRPKKLLRRINSASTHLGLKIVLNPALKHYIANEDLAANDYDGFKVLALLSNFFDRVVTFFFFFVLLKGLGSQLLQFSRGR